MQPDVHITAWFPDHWRNVTRTWCHVSWMWLCISSQQHNYLCYTSWTWPL